MIKLRCLLGNGGLVALRTMTLVMITAFAGYHVSAQESDYQKAIRTSVNSQYDSSLYYIDYAITQYKAQQKKDSLVLAINHKARLIWQTEGLTAAKNLMESALSIVDALPFGSEARIRAYDRLGQLYSYQSNFTQAKFYFEKAKASIDPKDPVSPYQISIYNNMVYLYMTMDENDVAEKIAKEAYELNVQIEGKDGKNLHNLLQRLLKLSTLKYDLQASQFYADEYRRVVELNYAPNDYVVASMHNSLGSFYQSFSDYERALYHRHKSVDIHYHIHKQSRNYQGLGVAYNNLGALYYQLNEYTLAAEYFEKAQQMMEIAYGGFGADMMGSVLWSVKAKQTIGMVKEAGEVLARAYELQEKHGPNNMSEIGYLEFYAAQFYDRQKNYQKAIQLYENSIAAYKQIGLEKSYYALFAKAYRAVALSHLEQHELSLQLQQEVIDDFRVTYPDRKIDLVARMLDLSITNRDAGKLDEALVVSDLFFLQYLGLDVVPKQSFQWVSELPYSYLIVKGILNRAMILDQFHKKTLNKRYLEELLTLVDHFGEYVSSHLYLFRTQATLIEQAELNKQVYGLAIEACWFLSGGGQQVSYVEKAFGYAERSRALLLRLASNNLLVDAGIHANDSTVMKDRAYRTQIGILNQQYLNAGRDDSLLSKMTAMMEEYRIFQDSLRKTNDELFLARYELTPPNLDVIREALLRKKETLIEYAATENSVFIFVLTSNGFHARRVDRSIFDDIKHLQDLHNLTPTSFAGPAYRLYESLIKPIEHYFASKRLLIIPDADLYYLNFEVLISHPGEQRFSQMPYLIRTYDISYLLSAASAIQFKKVYHSQKQKKALLFSPVFTDQMKANYRSSLPEQNMVEEDYLYLYRQPFALQAAKRIGKLVSHDLFAEQEAEERRFKQVVADYRILHLGTHAQVNNQSPLQSRFFFAKALADDTLNTDDGYLHAYEIYAMQLRAELAVLTACETGGGTWRNGEGVISLAHSFMHAGCPGVVMSLWKIDEQTSTDITTWFYKYLSKGYDKSEALRKAKLQLLNQRDEQLSHPYYWAGLTFIGEPSPIYPDRSWWYWLAGVVLVALVAWLWWKKRIFHDSTA